jgi:hypothetical protein
MHGTNAVTTNLPAAHSHPSVHWPGVLCQYTHHYGVSCLINRLTEQMQHQVIQPTVPSHTWYLVVVVSYTLH